MRITTVAVISIYDINAKANSLYRDFIKEQDETDRSELLYDEMQIFAENNLNMMRYLRR